MMLEAALRATEILLALAFIQQSAEHLFTTKKDRLVFSLRIVCCLALLAGVQTIPALVGLAAISLVLLSRFQGPYNGGSDRMSVLILWCLLITKIVPSLFWQEVVFGYLAFQLTLSYFISGKVKLLNPEWRSGRALQDVFAFSAYPVSEGLRRLADLPTLLWVMSWLVIGFEVLFLLTLLHHKALIAALCIGSCFHLANACLFGLNRFLWIWIAAYPSLLWFQDRIFGTG